MAIPCLSCRPAGRLPVFALGLLLAITSCQLPEPQTKEDYLQQFADLISKVTESCGVLSEKELNALDKRYLLYSREWYEQYYDQLTNREQLLVWKYRTQYMSCKISRGLHHTGKDFIRRLEDRLLQQSHFSPHSTEDRHFFFHNLNPLDHEKV